eukprot:snap_masked-scaffold_8-processed-gene-1.9-mRNA-1 protein AED:1.00 eAED:1.00 QI:0/0/0/0/1/1/2/0/572
MSTYLFILVSCFLIQDVYSSAQVPFITGNFTFLTPRYSNFIGDFDEECAIAAPMVKLGPEENMCDLDTIETNLTGQFGCYEEIVYENAIELGAVAVIDSVGVPPGSYESIHNAGQSFQKGDIPFLQVGTEFFATFGIEGLSPAFDFLSGTPIVIQGCGDTNLFNRCYDVYQTVYICFSFAALFGVFLAYKSAKKVTLTYSSRPRVVLIAYEALFLLFTAVVLFFGLELRQSKNLLRGDIISAKTKDVLGIVQLIGNIHGSLLNAIYWNALRKGCFLRDSQTALYWRKEFFLSPWQFISSALTASLIIGLLRANEKFHRGKIDQFKRLLQFGISVDIICGIVLFFSMLHFIVTLRKVIASSKSRSSFMGKESCMDKFHFFWITIKDFMRGKSFALRLSKLGTNNGSGVHAKLINLSLHLSKWLMLYVLIMICCSYFILFGFLEYLPFGLLQNDPEMCKAFSFFVGYICVKIFTSYCKIIGLGGPAKVKDTERVSIRKYTSNKRVFMTRRESSQMSPRVRVPSSPVPAPPVLENYGQGDHGHRDDGNQEPEVNSFSGEKYISSVLMPSPGRGIV